MKQIERPYYFLKKQLAIIQEAGKEKEEEIQPVRMITKLGAQWDEVKNS